MDYRKWRVKWTLILMIATFSAFCVSISFLLTEDRMTLALICVVAVICTVLATVIITYCFIEMKENEQICEVAYRQTLQNHFSNRLQTINPSLIIPPSSLFGRSNFPIITLHSRGPPSYRESAEMEHARVQTFSNAPPAYNYLDVENSNNIASFSPPPFYRPATPKLSTSSVQTRTLYLSAEDIASSPTTSRSIENTSVTRVQSPLFCASRKTNRNSSMNSVESISAVINENETSTPSRSQEIRTSSTQMFIDCSKAEPTLFTINREESLI